MFADQQIPIDRAGCELFERQLPIHLWVTQSGNIVGASQIGQRQRRAFQQRHIEHRGHARYAAHALQLIYHCRQRFQRVIREKRDPGLPGQYEKLITCILLGGLAEVGQIGVTLKQQRVRRSIQSQLGKLQQSHTNHQRKTQQYPDRFAQNQRIKSLDPGHD